MSYSVNRANATMALASIDHKSEAEKSSQAELKNLREKKKVLNENQMKHVKEAREHIEEAIEARDRSWFEKAGDWLSGDDPEAKAQEDQAANQAAINRDTHEGEIVSQQQRSSLDDASDANARAQATAQSAIESEKDRLEVSKSTFTA
jgi:hypothetical protein